ncbi:hypothetical protein RFI_05240 [Reticulomyxa filosa]|uniref:Uncharacterized protein n=1 Tax=Reticulomyxa filosa TaxID=46433 RepID=X6P103_RETFI|nr:hypothetical protein RFI_05240 [Reticulomyxa filosa]|eukprot:ETO31876.1 hypothetical protein RFI_05240 [Reticulomyxa filosa]
MPQGQGFEMHIPLPLQKIIHILLIIDLLVVDFFKKKINKTIEYHGKSFEIDSNRLEFEYFNVVVSYNNFGFSYSKKGEYNKSIENLDKRNGRKNKRFSIYYFFYYFVNNKTKLLNLNYFQICKNYRLKKIIQS